MLMRRELPPIWMAIKSYEVCVWQSRVRLEFRNASVTKTVQKSIAEGVF